MTKIVSADAAATQTEHPWRATFRTAVWTAIAAGVGLVVLGPQVIEAGLAVAGEHGYVVPEALHGVLTAVAGGLVVVSAVITRIAAIPGVEKILRRVLPFLAAAPPQVRDVIGDLIDATDDEWDPDAPEVEVADEGDEPDVSPLVDDTDDDYEPALDEVPGEWDGADSDEFEYDDLEALAAAEVDETPPPEGYEPRH